MNTRSQAIAKLARASAIQKVVNVVGFGLLCACFLAMLVVAVFQ